MGRRSSEKQRNNLFFNLRFTVLRIYLYFVNCKIVNKKTPCLCVSVFHVNEVFMKSIIIAIGLGGWCMHAYAQEQMPDTVLNRTVVVENQYNPEVMDAFKINVLPEVEEPAVLKRHIDYATSLRPFSAWSFTPMQAMTSDEKQPEAPRGYARAAYGTGNNVDARLSYLWDISRRDCLGFSSSLYGRDGDIPSAVPGADDWKSRFYRTDITLDYRHEFRKVSLGVGGAFASQVFNYMPVGGEPEEESFVPGRQRYTLGEGYVRLASVAGELPLDFSFQTGLRSFSSAHDMYLMGHGSENIVHTLGFVSGAINEEQRIGIGFAMDNLIHDIDQTDYTLLRLNPHYTFDNGRVQLRAGMHVDAQFGHDGRLMVSPDVKLDFLFADTYRLYVHATGGTELNDFRRLNGLSPYGIPLGQMQTTYTPVDLQAGLKGAPIPGLGFRLYGGYRVVKDEIFHLPYVLEGHYPYAYVGFAQEKATVGYGGAGLAYQYKDWIDMTLKGVYSHWDVKEGMEALLFLKPEFALDASARAKVYKGLWVKAQYRFEKRAEGEGPESAEEVNDLSLSAGYGFFNRLDVFAKVDNLLNRTYLTETGYPVQGVNVMAGVSVRF